jgi:hypothetical protein
MNVNFDLETPLVPASGTHRHDRKVLAHSTNGTPVNGDTERQGWEPTPQRATLPTCETACQSSAPTSWPT